MRPYLNRSLFIPLALVRNDDGHRCVSANLSFGARGKEPRPQSPLLDYFAAGQPCIWAVWLTSLSRTRSLWWLRSLVGALFGLGAMFFACRSIRCLAAGLAGSGTRCLKNPQAVGCSHCWIPRPALMRPPGRRRGKWKPNSAERVVMPGWRVAARKVLAPQRRLLSAIVLVAILEFVANEVFAWGLLGLYGRKSEAVALLIGLLAYVFVLPTYDELTATQDEDPTGSNLPR